MDRKFGKELDEGLYNFLVCFCKRNSLEYVLNMFLKKSSNLFIFLGKGAWNHSYVFILFFCLKLKYRYWFA